MKKPAILSRRALLKGSGAVLLGVASAPTWDMVWQDRQGRDGGALVEKIWDPEIRAGVAAAVNKNLIPAASERVYPGHFTISADGGAYGADTTWPGLDSWQMSGAYLLIGRTRLAEDYFDFVRASQRKDGNIPFAIFNGDTQPGDTYLRGMKYPTTSSTTIHRSARACRQPARRPGNGSACSATGSSSLIH